MQSNTIRLTMMGASDEYKIPLHTDSYIKFDYPETNQITVFIQRKSGEQVDYMVEITERPKGQSFIQEGDVYTVYDEFTDEITNLEYFRQDSYDVVRMTFPTIGMTYFYGYDDARIKVK